MDNKDLLFLLYLQLMSMGYVYLFKYEQDLLHER